MRGDKYYLNDQDGNWPITQQRRRAAVFDDTYQPVSDSEEEESPEARLDRFNFWVMNARGIKFQDICKI